MKYMTLLYMVAICVYNLQPYYANSITVRLFGNDILIWQVFFHFFVQLTLAFSFYTFWRREILKTSKALYLAGFIFASFYTIFQILTITTKNVAGYLGMVNSALWSSISVIIVITMLYLAYDTNSKRKVN